MKPASSALVTYLNGLRAQGDATLLMGDLFTITLASGMVLTYTNLDIPVTFDGTVFLANSLLIAGLKYKCTCGVNVDQQKVTISAKPTDMIGGIPFLQAMQQGLLDGAFVQRERAFFSSFMAPPIGTIVLFKGRVAQIDSIGRTTAQVTVASDLVLLDINMPRNVWQPNCLHVLYDGGCGLNRTAFSANGIVGTGSSLTQIMWSGATSAYQQGAIRFTSGANVGVEATVKAATTGILSLAYPLLNQPTAGDAFTVAQGCDHTMATCKAKFNNLTNFRGFPFVPPPQIITGPLSTTHASGK